MGERPGMQPQKDFGARSPEGGVGGTDSGDGSQDLGTLRHAGGGAAMGRGLRREGNRAGRIPIRP